MILRLYGMGLQGDREFNNILEVRERIKEVKIKNPEWRNYEIIDNGNIIEQNTFDEFENNLVKNLIKQNENP